MPQDFSTLGPSRIKYLATPVHKESLGRVIPDGEGPAEGINV